MAKKIGVVGSSNIDFVLKVAEMPQKGETILSQSFEKIPGGKGANQACACGKLGGDCVFFSVIGDDGLGDIVLESLRDAAVDVSYVVKEKDVPSGLAMITVDDGGNNSIVLVQGANEKCDTDYFAQNKEALQQADIILLQLETPQQGIYDLIHWLKQQGKTIILDPAPAPESIPDDVLKGLSYLTPNETELAKLSGQKAETLQEIASAANQLVEKGVAHVLVTMGARGVMHCDGKSEQVYPAQSVSCVDTTAAGDTFNGALAVGLAEGMPLAQAILFANQAAAISVTRKGAQISIPTRKEMLGINQQK